MVPIACGNVRTDDSWPGRAATSVAVVGYDERWATAVCESCDPVFEAANVGFVRHAPSVTDSRVNAILWEAEPEKFAARYPSSDIVESYGEEQWPEVHCVDYWLHPDPDKGVLRLSMEGWNLPEVLLRSTGDGRFDGMDAAAVFARVLDVRWPLGEA